MVSKRDGYWVPGVETKESAMLSAGEFSNLMCGVDILKRAYLCRWWDAGYCSLLRGG